MNILKECSTFAYGLVFRYKEFFLTVILLIVIDTTVLKATIAPQDIVIISENSSESFYKKIEMWKLLLKKSIYD